MQRGVAYDSAAAVSFCGAISAIMHFTSLATSAEMAAEALMRCRQTSSACCTISCMSGAPIERNLARQISSSCLSWSEQPAPPPRSGSATHTDYQVIASTVLLAFRPSPLILQGADALAMELKLPVRFGCVHARVERDMARMSNVARAVTISDYVDGVLHADSVAPVSDVFVASGEHITLPLSYTGPRWRQASTKIDFDATNTHANFTYLHASLIDFTLCRRASWFVGFGYSSFSRILAELQQVDNGRGWTSICPGRHDDFASSELSLLHMIWALCAVNQTLTIGSFGWSS